MSSGSGSSGSGSSGSGSSGSGSSGSGSSGGSSSGGGSGGNGQTPSLAVARAMLASAPGRRKLDLVHDAPDPRAFVQRLPAEDLYFAIKEIGLSDAAELVALASPSQFRTFVDLDAWRRDQVDPAQVLLWLRLAREGARVSQTFRKKRASLDPELVLLVLLTQTRVHSLEENEEPFLTSDNFLRTAEGKYFVEILAEGDDGVTTRQLVEDFIDEDPFQATRMFEAVRWEQRAELEETALRWRTGRLRDLGFPDLEEATRIWAPLPRGWAPRESESSPGPVAGVPALLLSSSRERLFLDRVGARLADADRTRFNEGLLYLLNCSLVADGIDPKDLDLARDTLQATRNMLSLGLELQARGDEALALRLLATTPATELFRVAVSRLAELGREAAAVARPLAFGEGRLTALDSPEAEVLAGLRRRRPRLYAPAGTAEKAEASEWRAYREVADLDRAQRALATARVAARLLERLGVDPSRFQELADASGRAVSALTVGQVVLTAASRALLGEEPRPVPLGTSEVPRLGASFDGGALTAEARTALDGFFQRLGEGLAGEERDAFDALIERGRARFVEEVGGPAAAGGLDARFVDCVLVRVD